jgi:nicotinamide-nucleotide amidase
MTTPPPSLKELMLRTPPWTLAVAESLTSGRLQALVGSIPGASTFFLGGLTAYSLDQKVTLLGVDRAAAAAVNCVSARVAEAMACGVCARFGADVGVATTGYAEPAPEFGVKTPFAWWAVARRHADGRCTVRSATLECPGASRVETQNQVATAALAGLIDFLAVQRPTP